MEAQDLERFSAQVKNAYADLAEGYYLEANVQPEMRITREGLRIFIPFA
jgi:hypothetical protein